MEDMQQQQLQQQHQQLQQQILLQQQQQQQHQQQYQQQQQQQNEQNLGNLGMLGFQGLGNQNLNFMNNQQQQHQNGLQQQQNYTSLQDINTASKLEDDDIMNQHKIEDISNLHEQQTGGGAFYQCGIKDCNKQFVGKKKEETAKSELLPHIRDVHQEVYAIIPTNSSQADILKLITRNYLKKSRKDQKKNYYCKICPKNELGEPPRFSQVENVHQRSGLEAHVKRQHPEYWDQEDQKTLQQDSQIKWMNQWCGYDGPAKTKGGRPNKKFIIEKYNTEKEDVKMDSLLDSEDEAFFLEIGIDVKKNKQIGTEEYQKHLEISHELFNNKDKIQSLSEPTIDFNEQQILQLFSTENLLDPNSIQKFSNLLHLIRNQRGEDEGQYPENSKSKISEIIRISCWLVAQQMIPSLQQIQLLQGDNYSQIVNDYQNVRDSFQEFVEKMQDLQRSDINNNEE